MMHEPQFTARCLEGSVFSFPHLSLVHPYPRQLLKIVPHFMNHTTYYPSFVFHSYVAVLIVFAVLD